METDIVIGQFKGNRTGWRDKGFWDQDQEIKERECLSFIHCLT